MNVVLVAGGRELNDKKLVFDTLDRVHAEKGIECVLHGACPNRKDKYTSHPIYSADMLAEAWAKKREIPYMGVPAKWVTGKAKGPAEGPIRNQTMADMTPHYGVIFPGGRGSKDMLERLIAAKIPHEVVHG